MKNVQDNRFESCSNHYYYHFQISITMKKFILLIVLITAIAFESNAQTYNGMIYTMKRENNVDQIFEQPGHVIISSRGLIDFGDMVFVPYDDDFAFFLGVPKELAKKYDTDQVIKMTFELYEKEKSPPVLQIYMVDSNTFHFMMYLRSTENDQDYVIQTFLGKSSF